VIVVAVAVVTEEERVLVDVQLQPAKVLPMPSRTA
jgi:hypothetical protein